MSQRPVVVTGSEGLIGRALRASLIARGCAVVGFDVAGRGAEHGDVRDAVAVRRAVRGCRGVVHLAAVSRVAAAEASPEACRAINVAALEGLLVALADEPRPPWLVFASSREVYGCPERLPVDEDAPLRPINVYAQSKVEGERLVSEAQASGLSAVTLRFANVYGSTRDHADRVIPAFARAAAAGADIMVRGSRCSFDFTHIADVSEAVARVVELLDRGVRLPTLHVVSGQSTSLGELAVSARRLSGGRSRLVECEASTLHVPQFVGDGARARHWLGWAATTPVADGFARLVEAYRREGG